MIDIVNLSVQFSGSYLFEGVNLKILPNDRIALVGSNGTGKSTLLKILAGKQNQEDGSIQSKKGLKIGYLPQELMSQNSRSVFEEVRRSIDFIKNIEEEELTIIKKLDEINIQQPEHDKLLEKSGSINYQKEQLGYYEINSKIEKILIGLGFNVADFSQKTAELSGGWQMRVELAKILANENDIILLDEPTNHLDLDSLQWLIRFLKSFKGSIIIVSHDRYFVNSLCSKTLEIYNNCVTFFKGNYNAYINFKDEREERLKIELRDQQKKIKQTEEFIERFRYKATKAKQVQSRIKQLEKIERINLTNNENKIHFKFFETQQSGVLPLKINNLSKAYGDNLVLNNVTLQIERGEKIALVGPNGAGKTTFAKILSNRLAPDSGNVETGHNTIISFYAQDVVDNLNVDNDIITEISESDKENTISQLRKILGAFLFHGDDIFKKISVLSGGEKSRVALAKVLLTKANTIILDEPTNHLDYDSKRIVQNALTQFKGTLIIVSHDIDFLKPIITKVIEVRKKNIQEIYGGIEYYLSKKEEIEDKSEIEEDFTNSNNKLNRKFEKRIQAEKRQKEYSATKDLKQVIHFLEIEIDKLESKRKDLESQFLHEEVYSDPKKSRQNKLEIEIIEEKLGKIYHEWTDKSDQLEKIMREINSDEQNSNA